MIKQQKGSEEHKKGNMVPFKTPYSCMRPCSEICASVLYESYCSRSIDSQKGMIMRKSQERGMNIE